MERHTRHSHECAIEDSQLRLLQIEAAPREVDAMAQLLLREIVT